MNGRAAKGRFVPESRVGHAGIFAGRFLQKSAPPMGDFRTLMSTSSLIAPGEVHVLLRVPEGQDRSDLEQAWSVLSAEERARAESLHFSRDRIAFIVAHGLLRRTLARYVNVSAEALEFQAGAYGRPELVLPSDGPPLRFNLSHTDGLVGCAVTVADDVGFDVEIVRHPAPIEVAERYFSPLEVEALRRLPLREQGERFYELWTLKESYVKGLALGLSAPLQSFSVEPMRGGEAQLNQHDDRRESRGWRLQSWRLERHWAALAVRSDHAARQVTLSMD
jgi:4'-phosphopantetheinyl transferase